MYHLFQFAGETCIQRNVDHAFIPADPANTDYQAYMAWAETQPQEVPPSD